MLHLKSVNHIAIIASDYNRSRSFYTQVLGMEVIDEEYRAERNSMMGRLALNGEYLIELFSFPDSPSRPSYPEACGLRHLAFTVADIPKPFLCWSGCWSPTSLSGLRPMGKNSVSSMTPTDCRLNLWKKVSPSKCFNT